MEKYIALLRGINVGGKNKVLMPGLRMLFEQNGFSDVLTYINSGNVIFKSNIVDVEKIKTMCDRFLVENYPFEIPLMIILAKDFSAAMDNAPAWWNTDKNAKNNAIFVIPPATVQEVFAQVGDAKPEYEQVDYYGQVIFWSAAVKTYSRTSWSKIAGSSVYGSITIRNANTANRLEQLANRRH